MQILLFILLVIITIIVFGLSVVGLILKAIFGIGHRFSSSSRPRQNESGRSADQQSYSQGTHRPMDHEEEIFSDDVPRKKHKKIFTQDEGEYVDFEEIKE